MKTFTPFVAEEIEAAGLFGKDAELSKPLGKQIAEDVERDLVKKILKNKKAKITKGKITKKRFNKKRNENLNKGGKVKTKKGVKKLISTGKPLRIKAKKEKGSGKQANTSQIRELARVKTYINKRLPAEVRRNMGRPALMNQTGRFSNSAELISLTQAQQTIVAKYTYLLNPYATFENTGKRSWPLAYNPKPLIAKSIRNLAMGRIEQKLTTRRV